MQARLPTAAARAGDTRRSKLADPQLVAAIERSDGTPAVSCQQPLAPIVVYVDEADQCVAVALVDTKPVDHKVVHLLTDAAMLGRRGNSENLKPDALDINSDDVLPSSDRDERTTILDKADVTALEHRPRDIVEPTDRSGVDPVLHLVLARPPGRAHEPAELPASAPAGLNRRRINALRRWRGGRAPRR